MGFGGGGAGAAGLPPVTPPFSFMTFEEDYTLNTGWTQIGTLVTVDSGAAGKCDFATVTGASDRRVFKSMPLMSNTAWRLVCAVNPTASVTPSHTIIALTELSGEPEASAQDELGISYTDAGTIGFSAFSKDGAGALNVGVKITAAVGSIYYLQLDRTSTTNLRLSVFTDPARMTHIAGSPQNLVIPASVQGLVFLQHSGTLGGGAGRSLTCTIDHLQVWNNL